MYGLCVYCVHLHISYFPYMVSSHSILEFTTKTASAHSRPCVPHCLSVSPTPLPLSPPLSPSLLPSPPLSHPSPPLSHPSPPLSPSLPLTPPHSPGVTVCIVPVDVEDLLPVHPLHAERQPRVQTSHRVLHLQARVYVPLLYTHVY